MRKKGQGAIILWLSFVGIIFLAISAVILSGVFDTVSSMYSFSGASFIIALIIPALAFGIFWGIIRGGEA